jgi:N-acetylglutamate synthase-like GNAT family acetyltransferase
MRTASHAPFELRLAGEADIPVLEALIPVSVRALQSAHYSTAQMDAAIGTIFGVDRQLIVDGSYLVAERDGRIVGCGGWSRRASLYGAGDAGHSAAMLDPAKDAARIRAFFIAPDCTRQGIGRAILEACEEAIAAAGFRRIELVATLAGEPLYASLAYLPIERYELPLPNGLPLPAVRMAKTIRG